MIAFAPHILNALRGNETLKAAVGDRIYYLTSPADVQTPFIGFEYTVNSERSDKDSARDSHELTVYCIAEDAEQMMNLADLVRGTLDGFESAQVMECELSDVALQYHGDAGLYESVLTFNAETI